MPLILCFLSLLASTLTSLAQGNWTTGANMNAGRTLAQGGVINGIWYVAGGSSSGDTSTLQAYNPVSNIWTNGAVLPDTDGGNDGRYEGSAAVLDDKLYIPGGWRTSPGLPTSTLLIYNPANNTWTTGTTMPTLSGDSVSGVINRKLYVMTAADGNSGYRQFLHVFDPDANNWTQLASLPSPRAAAGGGVIDGKLYVVGGTDGANNQSTLYRYNPADNTWTTLASMPTARHALGSAVLNGRLYTFGGNISGGTTNVVEVYDPASNSWYTDTPMPTTRAGAVAAAINGKIYVAGGGAALVTLEIFTPSSAPQIVATNYYGGAGDQRGMAIAVANASVYLAANGNETHSSSANSYLVKYPLALGTPTWSRAVNSGTAFFGLAADGTGLHPGGWSYSLTTDASGGKEVKAVLGNYPLDGSNGGSSEGSTWFAGSGGTASRGAFFSYGGVEWVNGVTVATENGSKVIYTAGGGQPASYAAYAVVKYDASGNRVAAATDSSVGVAFGSVSVPSTGGSDAGDVVVMGGKVYVAGQTGWTSEGDNPNGRPTVWIYNPSLTLQSRYRPTDVTGIFRGIATDGTSLYAVGYTYTASVADSEDFLVEKLDANGTRLWRTNWGGVSGDSLQKIVSVNGRLFTAGWTKSSGSGGKDVVLFEVNPANGAILSTNLWGGTLDDAALGIATDGTDLYLAGETRSYAVNGNTVGQNEAVVLRFVLGATNQAPVITTQPQSVAITVGATANFGVTATGPVLSYQWRSNNVAIAGATSSTLTLNNAQGSWSGSQYTVVVANEYGSITSAVATVTVNVPPTISVQPASQLITAGAVVTLTVTASGTAPLAYQWRSNGVDLVGATSASFSVTNMAAENAGPFSVFVSNVAGSTLSSNATLVYRHWEFIAGGAVTAPALGTDGTIYFGSADGRLYALDASGVKKWHYQTAGTVATPVVGLDGTIYAGSADQKLYAINPNGSKKWEFATGGSVGSSPALGLDGTAYFGSADGKLYAVSLVGTQKWAVTLTDAVNVSPVIRSDGVLYVPSGNSVRKLYAVNPDGSVLWLGPLSSGSLLNPSIGDDDAAYYWSFGAFRAVNPNGSQRWVYSTGSTENSGTAISPEGVLITADFGKLYGFNPNGTVNWQLNGGISGTPTLSADSTVYFGGLAAFDVSGTNKWSVSLGGSSSGAHAIAPDGTIYVGTSSGVMRALKGSSPLAGSPWPKARFDNRNSGNVRSLQHPPLISTHPASESVAQGGQASFSVQAFGTGTLSYQWRSNNVAIAGATSSTLTLNNAQGSWSGSQYAVVVSNSYGSITSAVATVTVQVPPTLNAQPRNQSLYAGNNLILGAGYAGSPLNFQWRKNGTPISGQTNALLFIPMTTTGNSGNYDVVVTNLAGSVTSAVATVTVNALPATRGVFGWGYFSYAAPSDLSSAIAVAAGRHHALALRNDGTVVAWGDDGQGKTNVPSGLSGVTAIAAGDAHSLALKTDGTVVAWGYNNYGQTNVPAGLSGVVAIAGGGAAYTSLAVKNDGTLVAWGADADGTVTGIPSGLSTPALANPVTLNGQVLTGVLAAASGAYHTVALKSDGTVVVWGANTFNYGQKNIPPGLNNVTAIAAGEAHTVALKSDGTVVAWGNNTSGQTNVPPGLSGVVSISAGVNYSLALKSDGTMVAWGAGKNPPPHIGGEEYGQSIIPYGLVGVMAVAGGGIHTYALVSAPPAIITQPVSQTVAAGANVTLFTWAGGPGPLTHQWRKNGVNIPSATSSNLVLNAVNTLTNGNYDVVIGNSLGSITSAVATVTVPTLQVANQGSGSVTINPRQSTYTPGQNVTLTPVAGRYYGFKQWSDGNTQNPRTITIGASNHFTAVFTNSVPLEWQVGSEWQKELGGSGREQQFASITRTTDGGYLVANQSISGADGNKTTPNLGNADWWIAKLDRDGNIQWQTSFGGTDEDNPTQAIQTSDGGYICVGWTRSGAGGTKTSPAYGAKDGWVVRFDAQGNLLWEKTFGGTSIEDFTTVYETPAGDFVISGTTFSGLNGNKTTATYGSGDFWILKLDDNGNLLWEKTYGGSGDDNIAWFALAPDGGYFFGGESTSGADGNKTSPYYGGGNDTWVIKTDTDGNKVLDLMFGGTGEDFGGVAFENGALLMAGSSGSAPGGNKTAPNYGDRDFWVVRMNEAGGVLWEKTYGGSGMDILGNARGTPDGGFLFSGFTESGISGTKTTAGFGSQDLWVVKADANGVQQWDYTLGGSGSDIYGTQKLPPIVTSNAGSLEIVLGINSSSGISGNKTVANFGQDDGWMIKLLAQEAPVGTPKILVDGAFKPNGSFTFGAPKSVTVSLTTSYAGGNILFTTDGTDPSGGDFYSGPFVISSSATIRALAFKSGEANRESDPVTINILPVYTLTDATSGGGTAAMAPSGGTYLAGTLVTNTATAVAGWSFVRWEISSGGGSATSIFTGNPLVLTMDGNKTIKAVFGTGLSTSVLGSGSVTLVPAAGPYPYGSAVRLSAIPAAGKFFNLWSGAAAGQVVSPLEFVVTNANPSIDAFFGTLGGSERALTILVNGNGTVTKNPQATKYNLNSTVTLTATPKSTNEVFVGWSGDLVGTITPTNVTMDASKTVTATFGLPFGDGLIVYYPFDGSANDASGNAFHGTVNGAVLTSDRFGSAAKAYSFDGANDSISSTIPTLPVGSSPRTISLWAKSEPPGVQGVTLAQWGSSQNTKAFGILHNSQPYTWQGQSFGGGNDVNSGVVVDTSWHHAVVTYSGSALEIYIDGIHRATLAVGITTDLSDLVIGTSLAAGQTDFFHGSIDEVRVYNRALSAQEVSDLFAFERPGGQLPALSITSPTGAEGDSGTVNAQFTVTLSASSADTVTVQYATANGTATAGSDYVAASGTLTFDPGQTSKSINVTVNGDYLIEPTETFTVTLSNPANATLGMAVGTGTIQNDDQLPGTSNPVSVTKIQGSNVTFSVVATGKAPVTYAWTKGASPVSNGGRISGAITADLQITGVLLADEGNYSVTVTDPSGNATSSPATLTVHVPAFVVTPPSSQSVLPGANVTFTLVGGGVPAPAYQWFKNGAPLGGQSGTSLQLNNVQTGDAGTYSVAVTNLMVGGVAGSNSASATLTVIVQAPVFVGVQGSGTAGKTPVKLLYDQGDAVTLAATNGRYATFSHWLSNGVQTAAGMSYPISVGPSNRYTAVFTNNTALEYLVAKQWEKTFGDGISGTGRHERIKTVVALVDGGFLLVGEQESAPASTTYDFWLVRVDDRGTKLWERTFGGSGSDSPAAALVTADGGFLIGGKSDSAGGTGDKTSPLHGVEDYWVLKLDGNGQKQWEASFGGSADDRLRALVATQDGGYVLGGVSFSGASGNKTSAGAGSGDFWVVKINGSGVKQWERSLGGTALDQLEALTATVDGGIVVGGSSASGIGADKFIGSIGGDDWWVLKLSSTGATQWQRAFGGSDTDLLLSVVQTRDGGFLLGGQSASSPNGTTKTAAARGQMDYWIVRTDNEGNRLWDQSYGGSDFETFATALELPHGGFALTGHSFSGTGGQKTVGTGGANHFWLVQVDHAGAIQAQAAYGLNGGSTLGRMALGADGGWLLVGATVLGGIADFHALKVFVREAPVGTPLITVNNTFDPAGNYFFGNSAQVSISSSYGQNQLFYTLNGGNPNVFENGSALSYSGPFTVTSSKTLRAGAFSGDFSVFREHDPVSLTVLPVYTLTIASANGGGITNTPVTAGNQYFSNDVVNLTATNASGWTFLNWANDLAGTGNPLTVFVRSNLTAGAIFGTPVQPTAIGSGTFVVQPSQALHAYGSLPRLIALPGVGVYFNRWLDAPAVDQYANPLAYQVTTPNPTMRALFSTLGANEFALTVVAEGSGMIQRSLETNKFNLNQQVTLTATPSPGHVFTGWGGTGGFTNNANPLVHTMTSSLVVTGYFIFNTPPTVQLTSPAAGQQFLVGTSIPLNANATDAQGPVSEVRFFTNGVLLVADTTSPFGATWNGAGLGNHTVGAVSVDAVGTLSTNHTFSITVTAAPPVIAQPPLDNAQLAGSNAVFTVTATGYPTLTYQWRHYGTNLPNATASNLVINAVQLANAGPYDVVVSNPGGSVTSVVAQLRVITLDHVREDFWVTDGPVQAIAQTNGVVYVGGEFQHVAPVAGGLAVTDGTTGAPLAGWPRVNGKVHAVVADGSGGWFIGGSFTQVGGLVRNNLAHLLASGSVDPNWNGSATGTVEALALAGSRLYVGGTFAGLGTGNRNGLGALDANTGQLLNWNPQASTSAQVYALRAVGDDVYVGGSFSAMGGASRQNVAKLNGLVDLGMAVAGWQADASDAVNALAVSGGTVFLGGEFQFVSSTERRKVAAVTTATGALVANWNPAGNQLLGATDRVNALAVAGSRLVIGGRFNMLRGSPRVGLGMVEAADGTVVANWNPAPGAGATVSALVVNGDTLYLGGLFGSVDGQTRESVAAVSLSASASYATGWNPNADAEVRALAVAGGAVVMGGDFKRVRRVPRSNLAAFDLATGAVLSGWNPGANGVVEALTLRGNTVYAGGAFTTVAGGTPRNRLAAFDGTTGAVQAWNPGADAVVYSLLATADRIYAGGTFGNAGGAVRSRLAALEPTGTGNALTWRADVTGDAVYSLAQAGTNLYVGGKFTQLGGISRSHLGAVNTGLDTGNVWLDWNPAPNAQVETLAVESGVVYVGGLFGQIGTKTRSFAAALGADGKATSWDPAASGYVAALAVDGRTVYAGGQFANLGRAARSNFGLLDDVAGDASSFNAPANQLVRHLSVSAGTVVVGGDFTSLGGRAATHLAVMGPLGPPVFLGQLQTLTANGGTTVWLTAPVLGQGPLFYQWRRGVSNLVGQNGAALVLGNVQTGDSGTYSVIVSNVINGVLTAITNDVASLTVVGVPELPTPPVGGTHAVGATVTLTATASGSEPYTFEWRLNSQLITNNVSNIAINVNGAVSTLTINNAQATNSGSYQVTVRNPYGAADSPVTPVLIGAAGNVLTLADAFESRLSITGNSGYVTGHNSGATLQLAQLEPQHAGRPGGSSVWVKWLAPANGVATFTTAGSGMDTLLGIYTTNNPADTTLAGLKRVASDDDSGGFTTSQASFNATNGVLYAIAVDGFGGATNHLVLSWNLEVVNEDVPVIVTHPKSKTVTNATETVTFTVDAVNRDGTKQGITYQWRHRGTALVDGPGVSGATTATLTVEVEAGNQAVFASYVCDVFIGGRKDRTYPAVLEYNDNKVNGVKASSSTARSKDKFEEVFEVEEDALPPGAGRLAGRQAAAVAGIGLAVSPGTIGTQILGNIGSTRDLFEPIIAGSGIGASRWFAVRATSNGTMILDTIGSEVNAAMTVWKGDAQTKLSTLGRPEATDRNSAPDGTNAFVVFSVQAGQSYLIATDSEVSGVTGRIHLNWRMGQEAKVEQNPVSLTVNRLENAVFTVGVSGEPPPSYQWRSNDIPIVFGTNATLVLTNVDLSASGSYSVVVSNLLGVATSGAAQLTVVDSIRFNLAPGSPPQVQPDKKFTFQLVTPKNKTIVIDASINLIDWIPVFTNNTPNGILPYTDDNAPANQRRFYRAREQ